MGIQASRNEELKLFEKMTKDFSALTLDAVRAKELLVRTGDSVGECSVDRIIDLLSEMNAILIAASTYVHRESEPDAAAIKIPFPESTDLENIRKFLKENSPEENADEN